MLRFEFLIEKTIIHKEHKKGIKWYVDFISKSIIYTTKHLSLFGLGDTGKIGANSITGFHIK